MAVTQATLSPRANGRADASLVWLTVLFVTLGILLVFDTTYFRSKMYYDSGFQMLGKHLVSIVMGVGLLGVLSRRRSTTIRLWARPVLVLSVMLLLLTHVPGIKHCANGACRWVTLGPLNFQPAELVKLAFVAVVASHLCSVQKRVHEWRYGVAPVVALMGALQLILVLQPDFGTVVLLGALAVSLMFLAGVPPLKLGLLCLPLVMGAALLVQLEPYRLRRFLCFLDPSQDPLGACYQLKMSFRTFASGSYTGIGLGSSLQKSGWLPEAHTDFVFAIVGEEGGLAGACFVLLLFIVFVYRGLRVAYRHPDPFGQLLAAGLTLTIAIQVLINMGVVLGLLPTKGLALPFLSYGNSSMLATLASVGMLLALSRELRER
ncbi:MAG TPA: putative lipid II flippase FtsW [Candidatus Binatia bacterium]|nr:putative lipid II flippase FtsW [Candidatus Binatia bacterium]